MDSSTLTALGLLAFTAALVLRIASTRKLRSLALQGRRSIAPTKEQSLLLLIWERNADKIQSGSFKDDLLAYSQRMLSDTSFGIKKCEAYADEPSNNAVHSALNVFPICEPIKGQVTFAFHDEGDLDRFAMRILELFDVGSNTRKMAAYVVSTSVYTEYGEYDGLATKGWHAKRANDWMDGIKSPFLIAHTAFPKPARYAGISNEEWAEKYWFAKQSPMSEMMQPRARYVRNVVIRTLTANAPAFAGIVIEAWPSKKHMDNPFLFFNARDPFTLIVNLTVMVRSVMNFCDLTVLQGSTMSEYLFHGES